ncbi:MAG TPA: DUF4175 family protein [Myxococcales bacterium]|nr:DUF4175 family protein [Myxococcales bacterium]
MIEPPLSPPGPQLPPPPPPAPPPAAAAEPPQAPGAFHRLISDVQARQRRQEWLVGALYGGTALALAFAASGFVAHASVGLGRALLLGAPFLGLAVTCAFGVWRSLRRVGDARRTARLIAQRVPHLSLDLLSAVELEADLQKDPAFSPDLARQFLTDVGQRASSIHGSAVVDPRALRRPWQVLAGAAAASVLAVVIWPSSWAAGLKLATAERPRAPFASTREPITGDFELTYRYPPYTGLMPRTVPGASGEISGPAGTEVVLKTRSDREVERAELLVDGKRLPLQVTGHRDLEGSLVLERAGTYAIAFFKGSREIARGPDTPIHVEADQPPKVSITSPAEDLEVDPGQKVTVKFEAADDYGLSGLELTYRLPGNAKEVHVPLKRDEGRRTRGQYVWDLGAVKLAPGDRVSYSVIATDNDEVSGKKSGASRTQVLRVYSAAELRRAARERAQRLWDRMVVQLADRMEGPDRDSSKTPAKVLAGQETDRAGTQLAADTQDAARQISQQRDAPQELWSALLNIGQSYAPRVQSTADSRRFYLRYQRSGVPDSAVSKRLARSVEQEVTELEKDVLYLETLIDRERLQELRQLAREMARERRELTSLLESYKQSQDAAVRDQIMQQIGQLRQRMAELSQKMSELASQIRDEHLNAEALQEMMREQDVGDALDEVEKLVREGKTDEALNKLQELSMQMDRMMQSLEQAGDDFGQEQNPELAQKFSEFMKDLNKTSEDQGKLADRTKEIRDRYKEQMKDRLRQRAQALKEQLQKEADQLLKDYRAVQPQELSMNADKPLEEVQSQLENLKNALKVEDFDLSAESAEQGLQAAEELRNLGDQQKRMDEVFERPPPMRQRSGQVAQQLQQDADRMRDIRRKLQQLFPPPGQMMSEEDRQRLRQMDQQQRQLQQRAQGLRDQMDEMQQMAPLFGDDAMDQMQRVGDRMRDASQQLSQRDPSRGYAQQREAMEQMKRFQEQLQQQQQQGRGGRGIPLPLASMPMRQGRGDGTDTSREKVEIPDEDQFQAPKEFRKDLLEAMKQGAPDKYKEQVKRYYEELVK